jgi:hypothetical protein
MVTNVRLVIARPIEMERFYMIQNYILIQNLIHYFHLNSENQFHRYPYLSDHNRKSK